MSSAGEKGAAGFVQRYGSGEEVRAGDQILYAEERGTIEFVTAADVPGDEWYFERFGPQGGVMILVKPFGRLFVTDAATDEELTFVARKPAG